jgi:hypothetical protein
MSRCVYESDDLLAPRASNNLPSVSCPAGNQVGSEHTYDSSSLAGSNERSRWLTVDEEEVNGTLSDLSTTRSTGFFSAALTGVLRVHARHELDERRVRPDRVAGRSVHDRVQTGRADAHAAGRACAPMLAPTLASSGASRPSMRFGMCSTRHAYTPRSMSARWEERHDARAKAPMGDRCGLSSANRGARIHAARGERG